jgi:hypothetical protein
MAAAPSYDLKVDRAEKHLIDLELEIRRYARLHPYHLTKGMKNKEEIYRFRFTRQPDDELAVIAGDFLYNIHSALHHLAAALVPSAHRRRTAFPMLWQGVWEPSVKGESEQRSKDRSRWTTYTRHMPDEAVAIIKANQPEDLGPDADNTHALAMLNRLRNRDAHTKLLFVASSLRYPIVRCRTGGPNPKVFTDSKFREDEGLVDGAELTNIPPDAVDVEIEGTPVVLLRVGKMPHGFLIDDVFREVLLVGTRKLIDKLRPFDRRN